VGYCCTAATTPAACGVDANVTCAAGATGYTCPNGVTPAAPLSCGAGVAESGGAVGYCCTTGTTSSTCTQSGALGCASGFAGYSCAGQDTPWQAVSTLLCEPAGMAGGYCCVTSANSCVQAPAINDCPAPYYGVACMGADTAQMASPALLCASDPSGTAMQFCCAKR
jgi:hypothetical protein